MSEIEDPKTLQRQQAILAVLAGRMTATQAARELGVSRKTYYEWLERALTGMRAALRDRPGGRPPKPEDPEKERLQEELETLGKERTVLEGRLRIQEAIREVWEQKEAEESAKKKREP